MKNTIRLITLAALATSMLGLGTGCATSRYEALESRQDRFDKRDDARQERRELRSDRADARFDRW